MSKHKYPSDQTGSNKKPKIEQDVIRQEVEKAYYEDAKGICIKLKHQNNVMKAVEFFRLQDLGINDEVLEYRLKGCQNEESAMVLLKVDISSKNNPDNFHAVVEVEGKLLLEEGFCDTDSELYTGKIIVHKNKLFDPEALADFTKNGCSQLLHKVIEKQYWGRLMDEYKHTKLLFDDYRILIYDKNNLAGDIVEQKVSLEEGLKRLDGNTQSSSDTGVVTDNQISVEAKVKEIALAMLRDGLPMNKISQYTGLDISGLEEMQENDTVPDQTYSSALVRRPLGSWLSWSVFTKDEPEFDAHIMGDGSQDSDVDAPI